MKVNTQELSALIQELQTLSSKPKLTWAEERRNAFLLSAISAVKAGASLAEVEHDADNERRSKAGLPPVKRVATEEQIGELRGFRALAEQRDVEGSITPRIGTYSGLGFFVPTGFFARVFESMKQHDPIFDDAAFTQFRNSVGHPFTVPLMDDTAHDASVVSEAGSQTEVDIAQPGQAVLGAYSYASRRWNVSMEALQDMEQGVSAMDLFRKFTAKALARGIGKDMLNGSGSGKTLGLIPSLLAAGAQTVIAAGAAANTGGSDSAATSLGTPDFASAYQKLDQAYLEDSSCRWIMSSKTLGSLYGVVDKYGSPILSFVTGAPTILGIPVLQSPSMPNMAASANSVLLGACSYWATRIVTPDGEGDGILSYREAPGLIENGLVGFRSFVRADGALLWNGASNSSCPFVIIQQHS
jgi:HK97 family phage major capsid protein